MRSKRVPLLDGSTRCLFRTAILSSFAVPTRATGLASRRGGCASWDCPQRCPIIITITLAPHLLSGIIISFINFFQATMSVSCNIATDSRPLVERRVELSQSVSLMHVTSPARLDAGLLASSGITSPETTRLSETP